MSTLRGLPVHVDKQTLTTRHQADQASKTAGYWLKGEIDYKTYRIKEKDLLGSTCERHNEHERRLDNIGSHPLCMAESWECWPAKLGTDLLWEQVDKHSGQHC